MQINSFKLQTNQNKQDNKPSFGSVFVQLPHGDEAILAAALKKIKPKLLDKDIFYKLADQQMNCKEFSVLKVDGYKIYGPREFHNDNSHDTTMEKHLEDQGFCVWQ